jgi:hypothetical protein
MNLSVNIKIIGAFIAGLLFPAFFHVSNSIASTASPTGEFICIGNYSTWGWRSNSGDNKEYNEMSYINFATRNASGIVNNASMGGGIAPTYQEGRVESGPFTISAGPIPGSYKLNWDNEYIIVAPVNSGNSLYMVDSGTGMTGTCQKI